MDRPKKLFLVSMLVNVVRIRNMVPDQMRMQVIVSAEDEEAARNKVDSLVTSLAATYNIDPIDSLDEVSDLPELTRRYCKERGFELAASASAALPTCS